MPAQNARIDLITSFLAKELGITQNSRVTSKDLLQMDGSAPLKPVKLITVPQDGEDAEYDIVAYPNAYVTMTQNVAVLPGAERYRARLSNDGTKIEEVNTSRTCNCCYTMASKDNIGEKVLFEASEGTVDYIARRAA